MGSFGPGNPYIQFHRPTCRKSHSRHYRPGPTHTLSNFHSHIISNAHHKKFKLNPYNMKTRLLPQTKRSLLSAALLLLLMLVSSVGWGQTANWQLTSNGSPTLTGSIIANDIAKGNSVLTLSYGTSGVSSEGWNVALKSSGLYYEYSISPTSGNNLIIKKFELYHSSSNGSMNVQIEYSKNSNFSSATSLTSFITSTTESTYTINNLSIQVNDGETLYFRVFGWNALVSIKSC